MVGAIGWSFFPSTFVVLFVRCILVGLCIVGGATGQITCVGKGPCKCSLSDGSAELDLTALAGNSSEPRFSNITGGDGDRYWFDPCVEFSLSGPTNVSSSCEDVAVCRYAVGQGTYFNCGKQQPEYVYFEHNNSITLIYNNSEEGVKLKFTSVVVKCIESSNDRLLVHGRDTDRPPAEYYNMTLETRYGCLQRTPAPQPGRPHRVSIGTMLIVIVLSAMILYCGVGCLFLRTVYGAQGTNQIPHYQFWSSLPGLIKDGCGFVSGRCKTKQPDGYDSL